MEIEAINPECLFIDYLGDLSHKETKLMAGDKVKYVKGFLRVLRDEERLLFLYNGCMLTSGWRIKLSKEGFGKLMASWAEKRGLKILITRERRSLVYNFFKKEAINGKRKEQ